MQESTARVHSTQQEESEQQGSVVLRGTRLETVPKIDIGLRLGITYLDLSNNLIKKIDIDSTLGAHSPFYGLRNLKFLDLSRNQIEILHPNLFENNSSLVSLNLSSNQLRKDIYLRCLFKLTRLKNLDLSHNCIYSLNYLGLEKYIRNSLPTLEHLCFKQVGQSFTDMFPSDKHKDKFVEQFGNLKCWDFKKTPLESGLFVKEKDALGGPAEGFLQISGGVFAAHGATKPAQPKQVIKKPLGEVNPNLPARRESQAAILTERETQAPAKPCHLEILKTPRHKQSSSISFNVSDMRVTEPSHMLHSPIRAPRNTHQQDLPCLPLPSGAVQELLNKSELVPGAKPFLQRREDKECSVEKSLCRSHTKKSYAGQQLTGSSSARKTVTNSKFRTQLQTTAGTSKAERKSGDPELATVSPLNQGLIMASDRNVKVSGFCAGETKAFSSLFNTDTGDKTKVSPRFGEESGLSDIKRKGSTPSRVNGHSQSRSDRSLRGLATLITPTKPLGPEPGQALNHQADNSLECVPSFEDPKKPLSWAMSFAMSQNYQEQEASANPQQQTDSSGGGTFDPSAAIINLTFETEPPLQFL